LQLLESKRPWKYGDGQIGGFVTRYQGVDFATIKGAGHMAPGWRAEQNYHLIDSFIRSANY
jgi:cathepsin A (carboxypeptidase C)